MKYTIHIPSILIGVASTALVFVALGAQKSPIVYKLPVEESLRIEGIPTPDELVSYFRPDIGSMQPGEARVLYSVPMDKRLVVTHFWSNYDGMDVVWEGSGGVLGSERVRVSVSWPFDEWARHAVGPGVTFAPGSDVMLWNYGGQPVNPDYAFLGFLVDA